MKKELLEHLRRSRATRRSRHHTQKTDNHGRISDTISISERPACVEDRAVPGHWEVRFVVRQLEQPDCKAGRAPQPLRDAGEGEGEGEGEWKRYRDSGERTDRKCPATASGTLPITGKGSRQGDGRSQAFYPEGDIQVYFRDPQNPWQRGTNENTNGLLRQYWMYLSHYSQGELDEKSLVQLPSVLTTLLRRPTDSSPLSP